MGIRFCLEDYMGVFTILSVEDNADHAALIRFALQGGFSGCDVKTASSGAGAREYLSSTILAGIGIPGLIILDMWLGDTTGLEVLEWLSERPKLADVPVIMFTSSADPELPQRAYDLGVRKFVLKPADFRSLVDVVKEVIPTLTPRDGRSGGAQLVG